MTRAYALALAARRLFVALAIGLLAINGMADLLCLASDGKSAICHW